MAKRKPSTGFPDFFRVRGSRGSDDPREQFVKEPLAAAQQAAFATSMTALKVLSALPDALVASRTRELRRLRETGRDDRAARMAETSVQELEQVKAVAGLLGNRARRMMKAFAEEEGLFHGFVSDENFEPQEGLTVRVGLRDAAGAKLDDQSLSETTASDGYFAISLSSFDGVSGRKAAERRITLEESTDAKEQPGIVAGVEIVDAKGKVVHRDPTPISLASNAKVYREYLVRRR